MPKRTTTPDAAPIVEEPTTTDPRVLTLQALIRVAQEAIQEGPTPRTKKRLRHMASMALKLTVDPCEKCDGTGEYHSLKYDWTGRCFACKGTGAAKS